MQFSASALRGLGEKGDNNSYTPTYTEGGQVYNAALPAGGLAPSPTNAIDKYLIDAYVQRASTFAGLALLVFGKGNLRLVGGVCLGYGLWMGGWFKL